MPATSSDLREARSSRDEPPRTHSAARALRPHVTEPGKRTYRIEVGHEHGVKPGNIIGAIANEAGLESQYIGRLSIRGEYSLVDLPEGMPAEIFAHLRKVWVSQQQLRISPWTGHDDQPPAVATAEKKPAGFKPSRTAAKSPPQSGQRPPRRK